MASHETFDIPIGKVVGPKGDTGTGIKSIKLLSTSGLNKTYRITMTDDTTFDFVVTDGNGITGASFDAQTNALTLTFDDGTSFTTPSLKGTKGDTGNGISKIEKTGTDGLVDTYTVTYTDGQTFTYTVTNGADGVSPEVTVTQISGGHTVEIEDADGVKTFDVLDGEVTEARMAEALATKSPVILETASGAIASFDDGADNMPIKKLVAQIEPVQEGTGDPSPDNVRPISGWTGAEIEQRGKNLLSRANYAGENRIIENDDGSISLKTIGYNGAYFEIKLKPGTYTYSDEVISGAGINRIYSNSLLLVQCNQSNGKNIGSFTITEEAVVRFVKAENTASTIANFQLELGSTATAYAPYTGNQISVTFPETIYGGKLGVTDGKLSSAYGIASIGDFNWTRGNRNNADTGYVFSVASTRFKANASVLASCFKSASNSGRWETLNVNEIMRQEKIFVIVADCNSTEEFLTAFADQTILSELAESAEYTLTGNEMETFYGTNNIWADTGDVEVTYPADTKLYIDGKIAEIQATILENIGG